MCVCVQNYTHTYIHTGIHGTSGVAVSVEMMMTIFLFFPKLTALLSACVRSFTNTYRYTYKHLYIVCIIYKTKKLNASFSRLSLLFSSSISNDKIHLNALVNFVDVIFSRDMAIIHIEIYIFSK